VPDSDEVFNETSNESALPSRGNSRTKTVTAITGNMRFMFICISF
jgi:hypothetical protein